MHGASRHLLKPRVARLRLQQQQATSAQAKIDLALFAALMKMTASHKELIAHVTRTQVSYPNEECPFPYGRAQYVYVIHTFLRIAALPRLAVCEDPRKIHKTSRFADKRPAG